MRACGPPALGAREGVGAGRAACFHQAALAKND